MVKTFLFFCMAGIFVPEQAFSCELGTLFMMTIGKPDYDSHSAVFETCTITGGNDHRMYVAVYHYANGMRIIDSRALDTNSFPDLTAADIAEIPQAQVEELDPSTQTINLTELDSGFADYDRSVERPQLLQNGEYEKLDLSIGVSGPTSDRPNRFGLNLLTATSERVTLNKNLKAQKLIRWIYQSCGHDSFEAVPEWPPKAAHP